MDIGKIVREVEVIPESEPEPVPLSDPVPERVPDPAERA